MSIINTINWQYFKEDGYFIFDKSVDIACYSCFNFNHTIDAHKSKYEIQVMDRKLPLKEMPL